VIGSGIAGLVAAIRTQLSGMRTLVLEKQPRAGGLCGTFWVEDYEFAYGCNDFGAGFERELAALGVKIAFHRSKAEFNFGNRRLRLPLNPSTIGQLALRPLGLFRLFRRAKQVTTLGELIDQQSDDPLLTDLACLPAFALMRSPDDVSLKSLAREFSKELDYGYDSSRTPVGGPSALIRQMVARLTELGGILRLASEALEVRKVAGRFVVRTLSEELNCRQVITSEGRWNAYPDSAKPGLQVAVVLLAFDPKKFALPRKLHTLDWFKPGLGQMLRDLDQGVPIAHPSFHAFCSDIPPCNGCRTLTAFVPLARGERKLSAERQGSLLEHVCARLNDSYPGFEHALVKRYVFTPEQILKRTGAILAPSPLIPPIDFEKPANFDERTGLYHIGTSVGPAGEHAGAAALSGRLTAEQVIRVCLGCNAARETVAA
jgi:phytoene dehydrogenase-like protein